MLLGKHTALLCPGRESENRVGSFPEKRKALEKCSQGHSQLCRVLSPSSLVDAGTGEVIERVRRCHSGPKVDSSLRTLQNGTPALMGGFRI